MAPHTPSEEKPADTALNELAQTAQGEVIQTPLALKHFVHESGILGARLSGSNSSYSFKVSNPGKNDAQFESSKTTPRIWEYQRIRATIQTQLKDFRDREGL